LDAISVEALAGLRAAIQSLLPAQANANLQPSIDIQPVSISPAGLGGFVGINDNPAGEIVGRRVAGTVLIGLKAASANDMNGVLSGAINSLVAADRATLRGQGILQLTLAKVDELIPGAQTSVQQQVSIQILYEFLKVPVDAEDVIQQIPLNIQLQA
jgi:hypothetical protein